MPKTTRTPESIQERRRWWTGHTEVPYGLCWCGCGEETAIASYSVAVKRQLKGEPLLYVKGHHRRRSPVEYLEEDCGYETVCWVWQRGRSGKNYGVASKDGKAVGAHRLYYEREYGSILPNKHLDHLCRVTLCVRPSHLEPVTVAGNARRGLSAKLNESQAKEIRALCDAGHRGVDIARTFGVSRQLICDIKHRRKWVAD